MVLIRHSDCACVIDDRWLSDCTTVILYCNTVLCQILRLPRRRKLLPVFSLAFRITAPHSDWTEQTTQTPSSKIHFTTHNSQYIYTAHTAHSSIYIQGLNYLKLRTLRDFADPIVLAVILCSCFPVTRLWRRKCAVIFQRKRHWKQRW